jgi:hypothetical protein
MVNVDKIRSSYTLKEILELDKARAESRIKCKNCGHTILIPKKLKKRICSYCKRYVFLDDKEEFLYRMKEKINDRKR